MNKILLGYVSGKTPVFKENVKKLTHMHIAFGNLQNDGTIDVSHLNLREQIKKIREYNANLKICISLMDCNPDAYTRCCGDKHLRECFVASCVQMVTEYGVDGVDLDWEYPCVPSNGKMTSNYDRTNFTETIREIRDAFLKLPGKTPLLSIASGADIYYLSCVDVKEVSHYLDYICLMTYDLKCGFHALTGHHTPLYSTVGDVFQNSCDQALRLFHQAGVPKEKLLMGAAFYSRKWDNIKNQNHGFLQLAGTGGGYGPDYDVLQKEYINKNGYQYYWDDEAKAPFLFNGSTFISYDDERSLALKCDYIKRENYAGIFYWNHSCDKTGTLLNAMYKELQKD